LSVTYLLLITEHTTGMAHLKITPETDFNGCPSAPGNFLKVLTYRNCCKPFAVTSIWLVSLLQWEF